MARDTSVQAVVDAIVAAYSQAVDHEPAMQEIVAASGVSRPTVYRVLRESSEAQATLAAARAAFSAASGTEPASSKDDDEAIADSGAFAKAARSAIARLISQLQERDRTIAVLTRQLADADAASNVTSIINLRGRRNQTGEE